MADMSISGVASGVDWDSMMTKILENAKKPAYVMVEKRDKLERKKSLFEEFQIALQKLNSTLSPLKLPSTYKAKEVEIERLDRNGSHKGVLTATVNADAAVNVYDLQVVRLARSQVQRSNAFSANLGGAFSSGSLTGLSQSAFWISIGGKKVRIEVNSADTLESLAKRINTTLKTQQPPLGVTASVVDNKLILKSDATGFGSDTRKAAMTRSADAYDTLEGLFVNPSDEVVIKSKDGSKTWTKGVDFDVVAGNQIRWRGYEPQTVPAHEWYKVTYQAAGGDIYEKGDITRGAGDTDKDVLSFVPRTGLTAADISIKDENGADYVYGTDFTINGKSVRWLGTNRPVEGVAYKVTYKPAAGETFDIDLTRGAEDAVSGSSYADFAAGTSVIKQGGRTYVQGEDFDIVSDGGSPAGAVVRWRPEAAWGAPVPGSNYNVELTKADGTTQNFTGIARANVDALTMSDHGFTAAGGTIDPTAIYDYQSPPTSFGAGSFSVGGSGGVFSLTWTQPPTSPTPRDVPRYGDEYTVEHTYQKNTFTLSDDGSGILSALGLDLKDEAHFTDAEDAELILDGERVTRSSNKIGSEYDNELIKGMTIELKGLGQVSLDVSHDMEAAVNAIQSFVENYNSVMQWINTRSSEKAVDETKAATLDSDDFRLKWGLLFGNSLLRDAKTKMRYSVTQTYTHSFTQRKSADPIYGTMAQNGLLRNETLRVTVGARVANITITPEDTLDSIAAKINDGSEDGEASALHYDPDGRKYPTPFAKASVEDGRLVIDAGTDRPVQVGGSAALNALGMNYTYTGLYQLGLKTTSTDFGKSGELEFNTQDFMKAMTANAEEATDVMLAFAQDMQAFADGMLRTSAADSTGQGAVKGSVVREIDGLKTQVDSINKYLSSFEQRLQKKKETLFKQFSAAEQNLAKLMQQASWLSSVTAQLQNSGKSQ